MSKPVALVYGLAVAGAATARAMLRRGYRVVAADDRPSVDTLEAARDMGLDLYEAPAAPKVERLVERSDVVVPSPGVPETHPVIVSARRLAVPLRSEIDLAYEWEQRRPAGPRPIVAITGTDGKTTTTMLATAMAQASGRRAVAAGNTDVPLVSALELDVDAFVVECTSFRLAWTPCFRPHVATWLNLAPDHLDWHASMESYIAAKSRIWLHQQPSDVAIGYASDPVVMKAMAAAPGRHVTFGTASDADYDVEDGWLRGPSGRITEVAAMRRALPHDVTNALAAAATALEGGVATTDGVAAALASFVGPHHRIELVADRDGVRYYDDSKATTPHAALTAIRAFDNVVLVAGGRNKGLDLRELASEPARMRAVVAIGEAAPDIVTAFDGVCPVHVASSMDDAVSAARAAAVAGDTVLLSPATASFDWYTGYAARGEDFARAVRSQTGS
jgi:UDP-N-acetylmuramoylalanine--D-glutamate ligase